MATYNTVNSLITANLAPNTNITADKHKEVEKALLDFAESQWLKGDIKEVDCTNEYIANNFTNNGLGINERAGWAICNGYNNTRNRIGRVSVAYGGTYNPSGWTSTDFSSVGASIQSPAYGGEHTHTLSIAEMPRHRHDALLYAEGGNGYFAGGSTGAAGGDGTGITRYTGGTGSTDTNNLTAGTTAAHNIMQPYIVTLFIQKL